MITRNIFAFGTLALTALLTGCHTPGEAGENPATTPQTATVTNAATSSATRRSRPTTGELQPGQPVLPAQFQAVIYEVLAFSNGLASIDGKLLEKQAGTADALSKALARVGTVRELYRFDQQVNVFGEQLHIGSSEPVVTGTRSLSGGQSINQVQYQNVGAIIRFSAQPPPASTRRKTPDVMLAVEIAALAKSEVTLTPNQSMTTTRSVSLAQTGPLEFDQPRVMLAVSSSSGDPKQPPVMYVVRYRFSR
jgi:hypothetical protein